MEIPEAPNCYEFSAHNYGPFSVDIYRDAEVLADKGLIAIEKRPRSHNIFIITAAGESRVQEIKNEVPSRALDYLQSVIAWAQRQSFSGLVRAIYDRYPDFKVNSVFQY